MKYIKEYKIFTPAPNDTNYSGLNLKVLPELPDSTISLNCCNNLLTSLPDLPKSLTNLYCRNNMLTSLPKLPDTLTVLYCGDNLLTILPELPDSLTELYCYNNPWKEPFRKEIKDKFELEYSKENKKLFNTLEFQQKYLNDYPERLEEFREEFSLHPDLNMDYLTKNQLF